MGTAGQARRGTASVSHRRLWQITGSRTLGRALIPGLLAFLTVGAPPASRPNRAMSDAERRIGVSRSIPIRHSAFGVRHSTCLLLRARRVPVLLRVLHRPAAHPPPHGQVTPPVARAAQRHHGERIAVVGMMQLDRPPAAIGAAIGHGQQPQLPQAPRRPPDQRALGVPPSIEPVVPALPLAVQVTRRLHTLTPPHRVRRTTPAHPRAALRPVRRVVPPHGRAAARLAVGSASPAAVSNMELHQVLLFSTLRAHLRQWMLRIGNPVHAMSLIERLASQAAPVRLLSVDADVAGGFRFRVPGSGFQVPGSRFRVPAERTCPRNTLSTRNRNPPPSIQHPASSIQHPPPLPFPLPTSALCLLTFAF